MLMIASFLNRYATFLFWCSIFLCRFIFFLGWPKISIFVVAQRGHGSQSVAMVQVTTMAVDSNLLVVGGFQGELICKVFLLHKYSPTLWSCTLVS